MTAAPEPWYKHRWPWILMSGPLIVVVAASFSGWLAFTRQDALVADDYYKQGTAINQDLKRETKAASLGLNLNMVYLPQSRILSGALTSFGHPHAGTFTVTLAHATDPNKDIVLRVEPDVTGHFEIGMPGFEASLWKVTIENATHQWRLNGEWKWPQDAAVELAADLPPAD
ncbi:MAG: FixH family protein [Burkholderiaceae bacterium]|nr:FixH family protein [Burkholderiaceae bacterium]